MVAFQAEWCGPCRQEVQELRALRKSNPDVAIVTVGFLETVEQSKRFARTTGITWPTIADADGEISSAWKVLSLPATVLIDPAGRPAKRFVGSLTERNIIRAMKQISSSTGEATVTRSTEAASTEPDAGMTPSSVA